MALGRLRAAGPLLSRCEWELGSSACPRLEISAWVPCMWAGRQRPALLIPFCPPYSRADVLSTFCATDPFLEQDLQLHRITQYTSDMEAH